MTRRIPRRYSTNRAHVILTVSIKNGDEWIGGMQTTLPAQKEGVLLLSSLAMQLPATKLLMPGGCTMHLQSSIPSNGNLPVVLANSLAAWIQVDDSGPDTYIPPAVPAAPPPPPAQTTAAALTAEPTTSSTIPTITVCSTFPTNWEDSDGDRCLVYKNNRYCNPDGSYGPRWTVADTYQTYAAMGTHAGEACCECGGGAHTEIPDPEYDPNDPAGGGFDANTGGQCTALRMFAKALDGFRADVFNSNNKKRNALLQSIVAPSVTRNTCAEACISFGTKCIAFQFNPEDSICDLMKTSSVTLQVQAAGWMLFDRLNGCRAPETTSTKTRTQTTATSTTATTTTDACLTCIRQYSPVCGSDGSSEYFNPCFARCHGAVDFTHGNCAPTAAECPGCSNQDYSPVCSDDGTTFYNRCFAQCKGASNAGEGVCSLAQVDASRVRSAATCSELQLESPLRRFPNVCGRSDISPSGGSSSSSITLAEGESGLAQARVQCLGLEQTFSYAEATCSSYGMRLCSVDEQIGNVPAGAESLSCFNAAEKVWTMDQCPKGRYVTRGAAAGSNPAALPHQAQLWCSETGGGKTAAVQCCADTMTTTTTTTTTTMPTTPTKKQQQQQQQNPSNPNGADGSVAGHSARSCEDSGLKFKSVTFPTACGASKIDGTCYHKQSVSHRVTKVICEGAGLRLCTLDEVAGGVMMGSGCSVGKQSFMWTGDACENGGYMAATALPKWWGSIAPKCLPANVNAVPRCCADSAASISLAVAAAAATASLPAPAANGGSNVAPVPAQAPPPAPALPAVGELSTISCEMHGLKIKSSTMETVCGASQISGTCYHKQAVPFETAQEMCRGAGLRLCTLNEVENSVLAGSGCSVGKTTLMWTSDTCFGGSNYMAAPALPKRWSSTPPKCLGKGITAVPRCCADSMAALNAAAPTTAVSSPSPSPSPSPAPAPAPASSDCECIRSDAPVCAAGKTFASPCHASCANRLLAGMFPTYTPGACLAGGGSPACPSDVMDRFDSGIAGRLFRSKQRTLYSAAESNVRACAARCEAYGSTNSCRSFEFKSTGVGSGVCELKGADHWEVKTVKNTVWVLYNRVAVC